MSAQRNWKLFWWTLPAVLVFVAAGVFLLLLWIWSLTAGQAYANAEHDQAVTSYHRQAQVSEVFPEPWKGPYNEGTATLGLGDYSGAGTLLETALERVPVAPTDANGAKDPESNECFVRTNLSLAYEGQADDARANGDQDGAIGSYNLAMDTVGPCSSNGQSLSPTTFDQLNEAPVNYQDETEQRQLQKRDETQQGNGGDGSQSESEPEPSDEPSGGDSSPTLDPKAEELISQNQQAQQGAGSGSGSGSGTGGGQGW